jgi:ferredoxin-NADP reductase
MQATAAPEPTEAFDVRVASVVSEADGIVSLRLEDPAGGALPAWDPGAHIDVVTGTGIERQYSLCSDPADTSSWRIAVLREPESRGGSEWIHSAVRDGATLKVRGPRNHFPLRESAEYLFIAGGIGITPLLAMITKIEAAAGTWRLVYGGRALESMAFRDELAAYGDRVTFWPQDEHGHIDLPSLLAEPREDRLVYVCGPEPLLAAAEQRCTEWQAGLLNLERFAPKAGALDGPRSAFEVELRHSGMTLPVGADESILDVVTAAGIRVQVSCLEGTCGTCETTVLDGVPDHRDSFLTDAERQANDTMMVCCSRSMTDRLVLDL